MFPKVEISVLKLDDLSSQPGGPEEASPGPSVKPNIKQPEERKENGRIVELTSKAKREHRNSSLLRDNAPPRCPSPLPSPSPNICPFISSQTASGGKSSLSDPPSQPDENNSDLGTMSSGASVSRSRPRKWTGGAPLELPAGACLGAGAGTAAGAEVSSITSDYSTTSSITFLTGAESSALSPELQGGEEADDERSELVSEGRHVETDSESEFPVFAPGGGSSQSTPRPEQSRETTEERVGGAAALGTATTKQEARRLFPTQRMMECDTLSRRWSLKHKTDSDSSAEGAAGGGDRHGGKAESSSRLSRVLEVMKKGRSTSSISSSSRSESEREPAWRLKITERLKFRLRPSADDMLPPKSRAADARSKKKNIRRRHTMGGQRDFAELAVMNDWREQGGVDQTADLSPLEHLESSRSSHDFSFRDWIPKERHKGSRPNAEVAPRAVPEDSHPEDAPPPPQSKELVDSSRAQDKTRTSLETDAHPHKLSGGHVVRSRFYQYL